MNDTLKKNSTCTPQQTAQKRNKLIWTLVIMALFVCAAIWVPLPPHGRFTTPGIGSLGDAYFEFKDGHYAQIVFDGGGGRDGKECREPIGVYYKKDGRWFVVAGDNQSAEVRTTIFYLKFIMEDGHTFGPLYRYWRF
jgi:hypothetical protein